MAKASKTNSFGQFEIGKPQELGFDTERLDVLKAALQREVDEGRTPGCVMAVARHGQLAYKTSVGYRDPKSKAPLGEDCLFSIASMTKPVVSVATLQLFEEGRVLLGDTAGRHLPELADMRVGELAPDGSLRTRTAARQPTVQDLLRHTSGLTYQNRGVSALYQRYPGSSASAPALVTKAEMLATLAECPLLFDPGTKWEYGFSTDVLGFIVEETTRKPLGEAIGRSILKPLGMTDTAFELAESDHERYARAFDNDPATGEPLSVMHVDGRSRHWQPGGAGLVSTAADYLAFAQMLLDGGTYNSKRILGQKTVELMTSDHLGPDIENRIADTMDPACDGYGFGLGVAVRREDGLSASAGTAGDCYWSGVYGTYFWIDPVEELAVVFMTACPGPSRLRLRQLARALVYQAIAD
jgi:CubicO group peptidase (beta-lactamase class C family)